MREMSLHGIPVFSTFTVYSRQVLSGLGALLIKFVTFF